MTDIEKDDLDDALKSIEECVPDYIKIENKKRDVREYILGGDAIFTVGSKKKDWSFTYKFKEKRNKDYRLIYVLYGPDNTSAYRYIGYLNLKTMELNISTRWRMATDTDCIKLLTAFLAVVWSKEPKWPEGCIFLKSKHCAKCGKLLTTIESIERGFGPECYEAIKDRR